MNASSAAGAIHVPVGLFGFATKTTRVVGVIAARIAGRSWPKCRAGDLDARCTPRLRRERIDGKRVP